MLAGRLRGKSKKGESQQGRATDGVHKLCSSPWMPAISCGIAWSPTSSAKAKKINGNLDAAHPRETEFCSLN